MEYKSILYLRMHGIKDETTNFVYSFKKYGKHLEEIKKIIDQVKKYFNCDKIISIPSSETKTNRLQDIFGVDIQRIIPVEKRKYNHNKKIDIEKEEKTIKIKSVSGRILLLDDVCTTGESLNAYEKILLKNGATEVIKFSIGIGAKLKPKKLPIIFKAKKNYDNKNNDLDFSVEIPDTLFFKTEDLFIDMNFNEI